MTFFEGELMILWRLSDLVLLFFTGVLIQNILFLLFAVGRRHLEQRIFMCDIRRLMKLILWYSLIFLPVIVGIVMFKATYTRIGSPLKWFGEGERPEIPVIYIGLESFSSETAYGNHWIFILILCVWMAGVLTKGLVPCLRSRHALKKLKRSKEAQTDPALIGMVRRLERELGVRREVEILESSLLPEPFVTGWFHYRLYFPGQIRNEKERELLLRHELTHCRRGDSFYRRLLFLLYDLYWFNPFMHLFANYFVEVSEMACDDEVLEKCSPQERKLYAELLASLGTGDNFLRSATALTGHTESGLERRLKNMLRRENKRSRWYVIAVTAIVLSICPLTTVTAASGVSVLQDRVLSMMLPEIVEEMNGGINTLTEEVDFKEMGEMCDLGIHLGERGIQPVDTILEAGKAGIVDSMTLEKGNKVSFMLAGENSTDKFRVGYKDSSGKRTSVLSSNGEINHQFTISKKDTYTIFIENTSTKTIHLCGSVMIQQ